MRTPLQAAAEAVGVISGARVEELGQRGLVVIDRALFERVSRVTLDHSIIKRGRRDRWVVTTGAVVDFALFGGTFEDCLTWALAWDERIAAERLDARLEADGAAIDVSEDRP